MTSRRPVDRGQSAGDARPFGLTAGEVTAEAADEQARLLARLAAVLTRRQIGSLLVRRVAVNTESGRRRWNAPELLVPGPEGRRVATVTIGPRSGSYLIAVAGTPDGRPGGVETVPASKERGARVIAGYFADVAM
jgi:hypothetical protein